MRIRLLLVVTTALLVGGCSAPTPAGPAVVAGTPGQGVTTVRADLTGTGNPWLTLPDHEIRSRGESVCTGLGQFGTRFYLDVAETNQTTSPRPEEVVPDLDRAQTLAMVKAAVRGFCPDRIDMITW